MPTRFECSNVPIPEAVSGPYRVDLSVSPDERTILVAGRPSIPSEIYSRASQAAPSEQALEAFVDQLGLMLYTASWPPGSPRDYHQVATMPAPAFCLGTAISPGNAMAAVLVSELWSRTDYPTSLAASIERTKPLCDVLYTVPLRGGKPSPIAVLGGREFQDGFESRRTLTSVCWHEDGNSLFFCDSKCIRRIALDGRQTTIQNFANYRVLSPLQHKDGALRYVGCPWSDNPQANTSPGDGPKLMSVTDDLKIAAVDKLSNFLLTTSGCYFSAAVGTSQWAVANPLTGARGGGGGYEVRVGYYDIYHAPCRQHFIDKDTSLKYLYAPLRFLANDQELVVAKFGNFAQPDYACFSKAGFSQLVRVKLA